MVFSQAAYYGGAGWLHTKLLFVVVLTAFHMLCAKWRKTFVAGTNQRTERFFRLVNEIPTIAMIVIVILVVFKPFA